jgi:hypothetical protein
VARPRVFGYIRKQPRVYSMVEDSVEAWMTDKAFLSRKVRGVGTDDGTPNFTTEEYGPYSAKLYISVNREAFQQDHFELEKTSSLVIASDVEPKERDEVRVVREGISTVWRVEGSVDPRPSAWGMVPVYQMDVTRLEEY